MQLRFHFDEDAKEQAVIRALRERGLDVTTTAEMQLTGSDDRKQLTWALSQGRILVTHNGADFCRLHSELLRDEQHHSGIVIIEQQRFSIGEIMRRLVRLCGALDSDAMRDRIEFLSHW